MADNKYFWLKLPKNFFSRHDIKIIEAMPNGKEYAYFYVKLMAESITHEGYLRFNDLIPYNEEMLSTITNTNIDIVRSALKVLKHLEMIEVLDDQTLYLSEVKKLIGCESSVAERVRKHRESQKLLQCNDDVTKLKQNCNTEKELELEKELDIDIDKSISLSEQVRQMYSEICKSYPKLTKLSEKRKSAIKARLNTGYTINDFKLLFEKAETSLFLKGKNNRNWTATFDWLICDSNMAKVIDGNYDNKSEQKGEKHSYYLKANFENSMKIVQGDCDD